MSYKEVTCLLIGGPAHGSREVFIYSQIDKPMPDRINVNLPMAVGGSGAPQAYYKVTGLTVDDKPAVVAIYEPLGPQLSWPIALFEVRRFRNEFGEQVRELSEEESNPSIS